MGIPLLEKLFWKSWLVIKMHLELGVLKFVNFNDGQKANHMLTPIQYDVRKLSPNSSFSYFSKPYIRAFSNDVCMPDVFTITVDS